MCGIAGFFKFKPLTEPNKSTLEQMIAQLKHRGPDGFGFYRNNHAGLAHARLSIIDLSSGWQPLTNEDRSLWIVFNGEIFNYQDLRRDLQQRGHIFSTNSDTEVIIHLFEEKGPKCLEDLNGQFAIAILDTRKNELFLARDRMGIRPLFFTTHKDNFYFASEIKALFNADPTMTRAFNREALANVFTYWMPVNNQTVFDNIHQLPAGHWMLIDKSGAHSPHQYWELPLSPDAPGEYSEQYYAESLRELLIDSVRLRLRADVPVGAYLSGGLDSSAITSLVKNYTDTPLKTFSVSFSDKIFDEKQQQQQVVDYLRTDHHEVSCSYNDIASIFPQVIWHTEVPILRTAPSPLLLLSGLVRENQYKVVLTGEGADEILGGYDIFKEAKIRAFIHKNMHSSIRPLLLKRLYPYLALSPTKSAEYARTFFETDADPNDHFYAHRPRWKTTSRTHMFFTEEMQRFKAHPDDQLKEFSIPMKSLNFFLRAQFLESKTLLSNYLLSSQGDRMAMANSVEGRYPFLDHRLVEFAGRIPSKVKMKVLNEKNILKQAVRDILPQKIVQRKKQPYMAPDIPSFFDSKEPEYLEHYLSPAQLHEAGLFKPKSVAQLVTKCRKKSRQGFRENMAFTGILSTQIIYDRFIRGFEPKKPDPLVNVQVDINDSQSE